MPEVVYKIVSNVDGKVCVEQVTDDNYKERVQYVKVTVGPDGNVTSSVKQIKTGDNLVDGVMAAPVTEEATADEEEDGTASSLFGAVEGTNYQEIENDNSKKLVNALELLSDPSNPNKLTKDYNDVLLWLPNYIKSPNTLPNNFNENGIKSIVGKMIQSGKTEYIDLMKMMTEIIDLNKKGGFTMKSLSKLFGTKRRFVKKSRTSRRPGRSSRKHGSFRKRGSFRKHRSTRRR